MKQIYLFLVLFTGFLTSIAQSVPADELSFLFGNWELKTAEGKVTEHWKKEGNQLLGSSYKHDFKGNRTLTETIVLKQIKGKWQFLVTGYEKGNEGTTAFKLVSSKNNTFIFENLEHDFPQRIVYQPQGKAKLLAWIEGKVNGKDRKIDFPYTRKK